MSEQSMSKTRRIAGNSLIIFGGLVLGASAGAKFAHVPQVVAQLGAFGFSGNKLMLVAAAEISSAILFVLRPARSFGLVLVSAFLGGAIATHMQHGEPIAGPAVILTLAWIGIWLRHPQTLWSLNA